MQKRKRIQDTRQTTLIRCVGFLILGLLLAGCTEQQQYGVVKPICVKNINKLQAMEVAEDILVKMHFTIEKADTDTATLGIDTRRWRGFIRTRPLTGAQFFEFWRTDNVGAGNWLESNLHSIRRVVELNMSEQDEGPPQRPNRLCINCDVQKYRLSMPEHEVSSSARAYEMFSESNSALQNLRLNPEQKAGMAWIDLGKDRPLAAEILKRIKQQIASERAASNEI